MSKKVVLTKVQANSLKSALRLIGKDGDGEQLIVKLHVNRTNEDMWNEEWEPLNEPSLDTIIRALYIGYEVEKTPEEELLEIYLMNIDSEKQSEVSYAQGIECVLEKLKIKIKGINQ